MNKCIVDCVKCIKKFKSLGDITSLEDKIIWIEVDSSGSQESRDSMMDAFGDFCESNNTHFIMSLGSIKDIQVLSDEKLAEMGLKRLKEKE